MYSTGSQLTLRNCLLGENTAAGVGAAVYATKLAILNCTVSSNSCSNCLWGGIHVAATGVGVVTNSIVWGNSGLSISSDPGTSITVTYCDIQGGLFSGDPTNISADPLFIDPASGDYHLSSSSPCVDMGNSGAAAVLLTDLDGTPRITGAAVDIGADEVPVALLPGSGDDLDLYSWLNSTGDPMNSLKNATQGDLISLRFRSPGGILSGTAPWLLAQLYTSGSPPAGIPGLPVYVDIFSSLTLFGGLQVGPFTAPGLPPTGVDLHFQVPLGLNGFTLRSQGAAISPSAVNGLFATTNAHDIAIQ